MALLPTPTLEPVDADGRILPIDPARSRLDLPVVEPPPAVRGREGKGEGHGWAPARVRPLTAELARLSAQDPAFVREVEVLSAEGRGDMEALWGASEVRLRFHAPLSPLRIREARAALEDAAAREPGRTVATVDLRFADQVVVRYGDRR